MTQAAATLLEVNALIASKDWAGRPSQQFCEKSTFLLSHGCYCMSGFSELRLSKVALLLSRNRSLNDVEHYVVVGGVDGCWAGG